MGDNVRREKSTRGEWLRYIMLRTEIGLLPKSMRTTNRKIKCFNTMNSGKKDKFGRTKLFAFHSSIFQFK